jgi:hypothetical protein
MHSDKKEEKNLVDENLRNPNTTTYNEDLTFGRSPIKSPKSIRKRGNHIRSKILVRKNESIEGRVNFENELNLKTKEELKSNLAPERKIFNMYIENNENDLEESYKKKKKDWKSWSSAEKELFYEAIANGGNYTSLQKLFKTMNDVTKFLNRKLEQKAPKRLETIIIELSKM